MLQELYRQLGSALEQHLMPYPIILASPQIRMALKRLTERAVPRLVVLSYNEISRMIRLR